MFKYYLRPLNETDKKTISNALGLVTVRNKRFIKFVAISFILILIVGIPLVIRQHQKDVNLVYLGVVVILVYLGIVLWVYFENVGINRKRTSDFQEALLKDKARILHCKTTDMVELTEIEDEGAGYFFQVEADKVLYLGGQQYYPTSKFPNTDFEVVEILGKENVPVTFDIYCHGQKLKPKRIIEKEIKFKMLDGSHFPEDFDIIYGTLEGIEQRILEGSTKFSKLELIG